MSRTLLEYSGVASCLGGAAEGDVVETRSAPLDCGSARSGQDGGSFVLPQLRYAKRRACSALLQVRLQPEERGCGPQVQGHDDPLKPCATCANAEPRTRCADRAGLRWASRSQLPLGSNRRRRGPAGSWRVPLSRSAAICAASASARKSARSNDGRSAHDAARCSRCAAAATRHGRVSAAAALLPTGPGLAAPGRIPRLPDARPRVSASTAAHGSISWAAVPASGTRLPSATWLWASWPRVSSPWCRGLPGSRSAAGLGGSRLSSAGAYATAAPSVEGSTVATSHWCGLHHCECHSRSV